MFNEVGESAWSPAVSFTTASAVPDVVDGLCIANSTSESIAVQWPVRPPPPPPPPPTTPIVGDHPFAAADVSAVATKMLPTIIIQQPCQGCVAMLTTVLLRRGCG